MSDSEYILTDSQKQTVHHLRELIGAEASANPFCTPFNILRWYYAYEDLEEVARVLKRHLQIRKIKNLDRIEENKLDIDEVFDVHSPISILGRNKSNDNKVLIFELSGRIDIYGLISGIQATPFMNNRFRQMERILKEINKLEKETKLMSGGIFICDMQGLQLRANLINILRGPFRVMWGTLLEQYPGIFSQIIVVNAPKFINVLWTACAPFIDESYRKKILVTSENWRNEILEYVDAEFLPIYYGGTLKDKCDDYRCSSLISIPPEGRFPQLQNQLNLEMEILSISAGMKNVQVFEYDEGTELEFYVQHEDELTMAIFYSSQDISDHWKEDELEEVYASCERLSLCTVDQWRWMTPYSGFYYICYGNEKAWFMPVEVRQLIFFRKNERFYKAETLKNFCI